MSQTYFYFTLAQSREAHGSDLAAAHRARRVVLAPALLHQPSEALRVEAVAARRERHHAAVVQ